MTQFETNFLHDIRSIGVKFVVDNVVVRWTNCALANVLADHVKVVSVQKI